MLVPPAEVDWTFCTQPTVTAQHKSTAAVRHDNIPRIDIMVCHLRAAGQGHPTPVRSRFDDLTRQLLRLRPSNCEDCAKTGPETRETASEQRLRFRDSMVAVKL